MADFTKEIGHEETGVGFEDGLNLMSDNGPQPTSDRFMKTCSVLEVHRAFTCYNNARGNAHAERMMRTLKEELLRLREWRDPYEVSMAIGGWIEKYNQSYLHSTRAYKTPNAMEETHNLATRTLLKTAC